LAFGPDGNLYVTSYRTNAVLRYEGPLAGSPGAALPASGQSGATFVAPSSGGLLQPLNVVFGPDGNLYVDGGETLGILRYNGTTGAFMGTFEQGDNDSVFGRGMGFDQQGRLYVSDGANAVHRYDTQGNSLGDLLIDAVNPALSKPRGLTFDAQGNLLITCRDTNTVVRYDRGVNVTLSSASSTPVSVNYTTVDGTAVAGTNYFAESGTLNFAPGQTSQDILLATQEDPQAPGNVAFSVQLSNPSGGTTIGTGTAAVNVIVDNAARQFAIADSSAIEGNTTAHYRGAFVQGLPDSGSYDPTFGPDGNLYVSNDGGNPVAKFNGTTGASMGLFVPPVNGQASIVDGMVFNGGYLYVGSKPNSDVLQFNATTGAYVGVFVSGVSGGPKNLAIGPDANGNANADLYVSTSNGVTRYDGTTGASLGTYITNGSGGLSGAGSMTFDSSQTYLYVTSSTNQILKYNARTGAFVGVAASAGVSNPTDVKFGPDGLLYVLSSGNNRILRYTATGTYVDDYVPAGSGGMVGPIAMAFGPNGDLYVSGTASITNAATSQIYDFGTEAETVFTVTNTTASTLPLTVNYATADGTAHAGTSYTATNGTLTFAPGWTTATVDVPTLDSGSQTAPLAFTLTLSNPEGATLSRSQATGTIAPSDAAAKFYVVNGATSSLGGTNTAYKYQPSGTQQAGYGLSVTTATPDLNPQGIASNAAGTMQWVVDANLNVYVYSSSGTLLGSWAALGLPTGAQVTGIATNGTDIWLLDPPAVKVYKYTGAASRLSGSQSAASSIKLSTSDTNPQDMVTDGTSLWVVDGTALKVFKYKLSGTLLGSWSIDPANAHPTGITINPNNVSDIWIVDNGTDKVYHYVGAASRTSGSQNAAATFALAAGNTNPQGIADPPPASAAVPSAASHDAVFAQMVPPSPQAPDVPTIDLPATPWLDHGSSTVHGHHRGHHRPALATHASVMHHGR
jgi:hypothetical protein